MADLHIRQRTQQQQKETFFLLQFFNYAEEYNDA